MNDFAPLLEEQLPRLRRYARALARSLIDVIAKAHMMLKVRPHHETIEVWLGNSLVYCARQDRDAA